MTITQRAKTSRDGLRVSMPAIGTHVGKWIKLAVGEVVARARWTLAPNRYSCSHIYIGDSEVHNFGARWYFSDAKETNLCSECHCEHPMLWLSRIDGMVRYNEMEAAEEVHQLIERGEMEDVPQNHYRWQVVPEGTVSIQYCYHTGDLYSHISYRMADGLTSSLPIHHLHDLTEEQLDVFEAFFRDHMPEVALSREDASIRVGYDPSRDIYFNTHMMNPHQAGGMMLAILTHEDDDDYPYDD